MLGWDCQVKPADQDRLLPEVPPPDRLRISPHGNMHAVSRLIWPLDANDTRKGNR